MGKSAPALLLATLDTKREEIEYLAGRLSECGISCEILDISILPEAPGSKTPDKLEAMRQKARVARGTIRERVASGARVIVGLGGGTGAQIITESMTELPFDLPKVLITPMAFDIRPSISTTSIILVPTVVDLFGLNPTICRVLDNASAIVAGLVERTAPLGTEGKNTPSIGVSALGVTAAGVEAVVRHLRALGHGATVFHANGFGGNALSLWAKRGKLSGTIDYVIHELNFLMSGEMAAVPENRFTAASEAGLAQVVLPGGINFRTRGPRTGLTREDSAKPHYAHSPRFTHVGLSPEEMADAGRYLGAELAKANAPTTLVLPMGGFSSEDRPGGAIENPEGRTAFAEAARKSAGPHISVIELREVHINDSACAKVAVEALRPHLPANPSVETATL